MNCSIGTDVAYAANVIRNGGLVAFATETVYGLGADAGNPRAIARVFEAKGRPRFDPLIVHVDEPNAIHRLVMDFPESAQLLAEHFWPGPLTLVLRKRSAVPDLVTAGLPTVGVRVPSHPTARQLIRLAGVPIAAPSANPFGEVSPTTARHVVCQLGDRIDYVLDGGSCNVGIESTVLDLSTDGPRLLRPGGVTQEQIEAVIGPVYRSATPASPEQPQIAPGQLSRHYAPKTPMMIVGELSTVFPNSTIGLLTLRPVGHADRFGAVEVLSEQGELCEAAANFYAAVRRLDEKNLQQIVAVRFPDEGLGRALNDRLERASARS